MFFCRSYPTFAYVLLGGSEDLVSKLESTLIWIIHSRFRNLQV